MKGHIRPRGTDGKTWAIILEMERGPDGKRRQKWHAFRGTKREAQRELSRLLNDLNTGAYVEPSRMTVADYLQQWLKDVQPAIGAKAHQTYRGLIRTHIAPCLGHHPLTKLTPRHVQSFYTDRLANGRQDGQGGLSPQTVKHMHRILSEALQQAVKLQLLVRNPCAAVEVPQVPRKEMKCYDAAQAARLIAAAKGTRLWAPIVVAAGTGMRRGEIAGLRWRDVDLEGCQLVVQQSVEVAGGTIRFKAPKTERSRRTVDLPAFVVEALTRHKGEQAEHRLLLGPAYQDHDLVFPREDGTPLHPDTLTQGFRRLLAASDLPRIRFHDLRHTCVSLLLQQGVPVTVVSAQVGHSSATVTLGVYGHLLPGAGAEAARRLDAVFREAAGEG